jgi:hypothetical protein
LKPEREFGDILNATFTFLKQNFKPIIKALLFYVVPAALLMGIFTGISQISVSSTLYNPSEMRNPLDVFNIYLLFAYVLMFLAYSLVFGVILEYIKLYKIHNGPNFDFAQIGKEVLKDLRIILWSNFLIGLLSGLASLLLLIPGIYLGICFLLLLPIRIIEGKSFSDAMNRCFYLIKNNWWKTFLIFFVVSILVSMMGQVFNLPSAIYQFIIGIHLGTSGNFEINNTIVILFAIFASIGSLLLYSILSISLTLQYFNLVEQKESPDLLNQLETIGENEA